MSITTKDILSLECLVVGDTIRLTRQYQWEYILDMNNIVPLCIPVCPVRCLDSCEVKHLSCVSVQAKSTKILLVRISNFRIVLSLYLVQRIVITIILVGIPEFHNVIPLSSECQGQSLQSQLRSILYT